MTVATPAFEISSGPFKFLDYFTRDDQDRFEGRAEAIERVTVGIVQHRTFVLYGASGSGKTSLLLAGVIPELERRGYAPVYIRTLSDPEGDLRNELLSKWGERPSSSHAILDLVRGLSLEAPLVLVFDQFEEFFLRFSKTPEKRHQLLRVLRGLVAESAIDVRIVFSLRQEWLAELDDFRGDFPNVVSGEYRLQPLSAYGARQAIAKQLAFAAVEYEPRLLLQLVDALEEYNFDPTILQLMGSELYRRAEVRNPTHIRLLASDLAELGGVQQVFRRLLDDFAGSVEQQAQLTARAVLDALTTKEGTKLAVTVDRIAQLGFRATKDELRDILDALRRSGLVRKEQRKKLSSSESASDEAAMETQDWYELMHERLVSVIVEWLDLDSDYHAFCVAQDLVTNSARLDDWRTNPRVLLSQGALDGVVSRFSPRLSLSPREEEFVFRSAVFGQSPDLPEWSKRLGAEVRTRYLRQMLEDPGDEVRARAVQAVARLGASELADEVARLALEDRSPVVREEAGSALVAVGTEAHWDELVTALARPSTSKAASEALIRLSQSGADLPRKLSPYQRWWIRRDGRKRVLRAHRDDIRSAMKRGAATGTLIALAWSCFVGFPVVVFTGWAWGEQWTRSSMTGGTALAAAIGKLVTVVSMIGAGYGCLMAGSIRRQAALRPDLSGSQLVYRGGLWVFRVLAFALAAILAVASTSWSHGDFDEPWLVFGLAAGTLWILGAILKWLLVFLGRLGRRAAADAPWAPGWMWMFAASAAGPLLLTASAAALGNRIVPDDSWMLWVVVGGVISLLALLTSRETPPCQATGPDRPTNWARVVVVIGVALAIAAFSKLFGWDTLPLFAKTVQVQLTSSTRLEGTLGPGIPDADYFQLRIDGEPLVVARLAAEEDVKLSLGGVTSYLGRDSTIVLLPEGKHSFAVSGADDPEGRYVFQLDPITLRGNIDSDEWRFAGVRVYRDSTDLTTLRGTLSQRLSDGLAGSPVDVQLLDVAAGPEGRSDFEAEVAVYRVTTEMDSILEGRIASFVEPGAGLLRFGGVSGGMPTTVFTVPADGNGIVSLAVRVTPLRDDPRVLFSRADTVLALPESLSIAVGLRVSRAPSFAWVDQRLELLKSLRVLREQEGSDSLRAATRLREMKALLRDGTRRALVGKSMYAAAVFCKFGAFNESPSEVAAACDRAMREAPDYSGVRLAASIVLVKDRRYAAAARNLQILRRDPELTRRERGKMEDWWFAVRAGRDPFTRGVVDEIRMSQPDQ